MLQVSRKAKFMAAAVAPVLAALAASDSATAATVTWNGGGADNNFKTTANWVGGIAPVPGDALAFDGDTRPLPNNNFAVGTLFGGILFNSTTAVPFTLTGSQIGLNGNITDGAQSITQTIGLNLALQLTPTINVTSNGSLVISSIVSGGFGLNQTGGGLLTLSGANTFTGPLTVGNGAMLSVSSDGNLGATTSSLMLNGGSTLLTTGSSFTLNAARSIVITNAGGLTPPNATLNIPTGQTITYNGVISDGGTAGGLTKLSFGNLTLGGANTYTGATTVGNGTLTLDFTQASAPASNIISGSSALNFGTAAGANAGLGNTNNNRLVVTGKASTASAQTFNGTNVSLGQAVIQATSGSGGSATLNLGALTHDFGGVTNFILPASGSITTTTAVTNGILGGWATIGTGAAQNGVIQGNNLATVNGSNQIVAYTGYKDYQNAVAGDTGGLIAGGTQLNGNVTSSTNLRVNGNGANLPSPVTVSSGSGTTTDINTISFINSSSGGAVDGETLVIGNNNTLRLGKFGGIFRQDIGSTNRIYIGGATGSGNQTGNNGTAGSQDIGTLTAGGPGAGAGEIVFTVSMNSETTGNTGMFVEAKITDNPSGGAVSVVKTGAGPMKIDGHNTFSGGLYLLSGRVQFAGTDVGTANPDGGGTGPIYVYPGAQLFPSGATGTIANAMFLAGTGANADSTGAIRMGNTTLGGTVTLIGNARLGGGGAANGIGSLNSIISGQVTGSFGLDVGASGNSGGVNSVVLTNLTNNYSGDTTIVGRTGGTAGNTWLNIGTDQTTPTNGVIPHGVGAGNVVIGINGDTASSEALNLNGHSTTINGLANGPGLSTTAGQGVNLTFVENDSATNATLTLGDNNQTATFGGIIQNANAAYSGPGGGTLAITKIGSGVQTLSGVSTYTGATSINNGAISVTGSLSASSAVNVNTSASASGALYGTGTVGNVTLAAAASGTQKAVINPGATGAGSVGTLTVGTLAVGTGSDLQFDLVTPGASDRLNAGAVTFGGASTISPTGVASAGTYLLVNASSMSGSAPTLVAASDTRLTFAYSAGSYDGATGNTISIDVSGSAASLTWTGAGDTTTWDLHITPNWTSAAPTNPNLFFNGDTVTFDDSSSNRNIALGGTVAPGGVIVNNSTGDYTISGGGSITGSGGLVKSGTSAFTLGTVNSFTGGVTLNAGALNINANSLGSGLFIINGGTLGNTSGTAVTITANPTQTWNTDIVFDGPNNLNLGTGAVSSAVTSGTVRTITVNAGTLTVGGAITDTTNGGTDGLTKAGAGTLVLGAANSFSGAVSINAGTLRVGNFGALGSNTSPGTTVTSGATLDLGAITAANVAGGFGAMPFTISGTGVGGAGAITNSGTVAQQNAFQNITLAANSTVGGTGRFDLRGGTPVLNLNTFTLTKTGTNQFSLVDTTVNAGNLVVNQGILAIEASSTVADNSDGTSITVNSGATLQFFSNTGTVTRPIVIAGNATINDATGAAGTAAVGSNISLQGNVTFSSGNTSNLTMTGTITESGGARSLTKTGPGTLTLQSTANTYSGGTNINGGVLSFAALGTLGSGGLSFNGGTLQYPSGLTSDVSVLGITLNTNGGTIDSNGNTITLANNLVGPGGFGVRGGATVTLTGTNTYGGATTVQNGTLVLGSAGAFPGGGAVIMGTTLNDSATLDLAGHSITVSGLTTVGSGSMVIGSSSSTTSSILTYAGGGTPTTFGGTIQDSVNGGSGQTLSLAVTSGTLILTGTNSFNGSTTIASGATLQLGNGGTGGSIAAVGGVTDNGSLIINQSSGVSIPFAISGTGSLTQAGSGTTTLTGVKTYSGGTNVNGGVLNFDTGTIGTGAVSFNGGTLQYAGGNTTDISAPPVTINGGGASIDTNGNNVVFANAIGNGGSGGFTKLGAGSLTLNGTNTYSGNANVNAGSLTLAAGGSIASTNVTVASGATGIFNGALASNATVNANGATTFGGNTAASTLNRPLAALNIGSGMTVSVGASTFPFTPVVLHPTALTFADAGSKIDLTNNELITTSTLATIVPLITTTNQIISTSTGGALGTLQVGPEVAVRYTLLGDTNLDGKVDVTDLGNLASNYGATSGAIWVQGDTNYSGTVDVTDLGNLASNYGGQLASGPSAGGSSADGSSDPSAMFATSLASAAAGAGSAVPEPGSLALLGAGAIGLLGRRRRRIA